MQIYINKNILCQVVVRKFLFFDHDMWSCYMMMVGLSVSKSIKYRVCICYTQKIKLIYFLFFFMTNKWWIIYILIFNNNKKLFFFYHNNACSFPFDIKNNTEWNTRSIHSTLCYIIINSDNSMFVYVYKKKDMYVYYVYVTICLLYDDIIYRYAKNLCANKKEGSVKKI